MVFTTLARRALYWSLKTSCPSHSSHLPESSRNFRGAPSYTEQNSFLPSHAYSDVRWKFSNIIFFILFHQQFCWNRSWWPPSFKFCCRRWYRSYQQTWSRMVGGEIAKCFFPLGMLTRVWPVFSWRRCILEKAKNQKYLSKLGRWTIPYRV